jgi:hypothetical protein
MKLKPVPANGSKDILKVVDLYEKPALIGIYLGKSQGMHSWIYAFQNPENDEVKKLFGNKSLDSQMDDELIGKLLHVACPEIKTGYKNPFGIAKVSEVLGDDEEDAEGFSPQPSELYPPSAFQFSPPPPAPAQMPQPPTEPKPAESVAQANVLDRFFKKPS